KVGKNKRGRAGGVPAKDLAKVLEKYNSREMDDRWQYELAELYHEAGDAEKCAAACDQIILWYADGEYELKALELKKLYSELTPSQQSRYEHLQQSPEPEAEPASEPEDDSADLVPGESGETDTESEETQTPESPESDEDDTTDIEAEAESEPEPESAKEAESGKAASLSSMMDVFKKKNGSGKKQMIRLDSLSKEGILAALAGVSSNPEDNDEELIPEEAEVIEPEVPLLNREDVIVPADDGGEDLWERKPEFDFEKKEKEAEAEDDAFDLTASRPEDPDTAEEEETAEKEAPETAEVSSETPETEEIEDAEASESETVVTDTEEDSDDKYDDGVELIEADGTYQIDEIGSKEASIDATQFIPAAEIASLLAETEGKEKKPEDFVDDVIPEEPGLNMGEIMDAADEEIEAPRSRGSLFSRLKKSVRKPAADKKTKREKHIPEKKKESEEESDMSVADLLFAEAFLAEAVNDIKPAEVFTDTENAAKTADIEPDWSDMFEETKEEIPAEAETEAEVSEEVPAEAETEAEVAEEVPTETETEAEVAEEAPAEAETEAE
ncbi:MAG: hypothetical protein HUJ76_05070, partial [Parasporobacterium sp.]|nr:hypothetical protein [Parasporobacterium sp.]